MTTGSDLRTAHSMSRLVLLVAVSVLVSGCGSGSPAIRVESQQLWGSQLVLGLESLVYTRQFGGHGTGAEDQTGHLATFDLDTAALRIHGPLFGPEDPLHWRDYFCDRRFTLLATGGDAGSAACIADLVLERTGDRFRVRRAHSPRAGAEGDPWLMEARETAGRTLGPNAGIADRVTLDGRFYYPAFDAAYFRGDPAQTVGPQGGEFRVLYDAFEFEGEHLDRATTGFYFVRDATHPILLAKRCTNPVGGDGAIPISVSGELRLLCLRDGLLEMRAADGGLLMSTPFDAPSIMRLLHSPERQSVYVTESTSIDGAGVLRLVSWSYATGERREDLIPYEARFRPGRPGAAYRPPDDLVPVGRDESLARGATGASR